MKSSIFLVLLACGLTSGKLHLADFTQLCDLTKPNLNACVVNSANNLIPVLVKGIKDLNFPPLDPLRIPEMKVDQSNAPISIRLKLLDTIHTGLGTMKFHAASIDLDKNRWILNATLPNYALFGRYMANGRIILLPIIGDGHANFTLTNTKVDFIMQGHAKKEDDLLVHHLSNLKVIFGFDKCFISMTNLFGGNKQLSETVDQFIRTNSREVFEGLKVSLEKVYSSIYLNLIRRLVSNVPVSSIFITP
ncbi:hypothetical protein RUM44_012048 [Polyplax serrata]|uniref:Protein takeout n=1 Tax=Polyplax serrata TaxID=468196 RepID=A0ABR1BEL4_POLSC